jgi:ABC-type multidrug transport system ATPase subunit
VRLRGVGKRYGRGRPVLADVDLDLAAGEITAITGGNGSGKSTLLRILVGVTRPTAGTVTDRPKRIGYVPERFPSDERLSARSYLAHMGRLRGLSTRDAVGQAGSLMERLALAGGVDTALRRLSKGNLQKVGLAQALMVTPSLLVLDEPWSGLDSSAHGVLSEIMTGVADAGGTVVFTDHRESVVRTNATRAYRMAAGALAVVDNADEAVLVTRVVVRSPTVDVVPQWNGPGSGVLSVRRDGDRVVVRVSRAHTDRLLMAVLRDGWSVLRVDEPVTEWRTCPDGAVRQGA